MSKDVVNIHRNLWYRCKDDMSGAAARTGEFKKKKENKRI